MVGEIKAIFYKLGGTNLQVPDFVKIIDFKMSE
jgi:hypothetical protein